MGNIIFTTSGVYIPESTESTIFVSIWNIIPSCCHRNKGKVEYICLFGTCVFRIYIFILPHLCAIFAHCMLVHVTTVAQETKLAGQKG